LRRERSEERRFVKDQEKEQRKIRQGGEDISSNTTTDIRSRLGLRPAPTFWEVFAFCFCFECKG
jgi:hypothetical protein